MCQSIRNIPGVTRPPGDIWTFENWSVVISALQYNNAVQNVTLKPNLTMKCNSAKKTNFQYLETGSFAFKTAKFVDTLFGDPIAHKIDILPFELDHGSGNTCTPPNKKKGVNVQIPHLTQVKFKSPTIWLAFHVKCPSLRSQKMVKYP